MTTRVRVCPSCRFESPAQAFNCTRCGEMLVCTASVRSSGRGAVDPEPDESAEAPRAETEKLLERVVSGAGLEHRRTRAGYVVVVPLAGDRRQKVHVLFAGRDDEGQDVISFLSICGPADDRRAMALLRFNSKLTYAALAVRSIKGEDYFVVTANQLAATADAEEIRKMLIEVAKRADAVEKKIGSGKDVY